MNSYLPVTDDIYWIGVNDRHSALFEELWPLPRGVSYNAYVIVDEKIAVVETVKALGAESFLDKVHAVLPTGRTPDYLIIDHMEPDHSGRRPTIWDCFPRCSSLSRFSSAKSYAGAS